MPRYRYTRPALRTTIGLTVLLIILLLTDQLQKNKDIIPGFHTWFVYGHITNFVLSCILVLHVCLWLMMRGYVRYMWIFVGCLAAANVAAESVLTASTTGDVVDIAAGILGMCLGIGLVYFIRTKLKVAAKEKTPHQ